MRDNKDIAALVHAGLGQIAAIQTTYPLKGHHFDLADVYLGTSDWPVIRKVDEYNSRLRQAATYVNCTLAGFNFIAKVRPERIIFIDINRFSLHFYLYLTALVGLAESRAELISLLYSKNSAEIERLLQGAADDRRFNEIPVETAELDRNRRLFEQLGFSSEMMSFQLGFFRARVLVDHVVPEAPLDQRRPLYLFKNDFDRIYPLHPVSFFLGLGWLKDESTFTALKKALAKADCRFVNINLIAEPIWPRLADDGRPFPAVYYISNIGSTVTMDKERQDYFNKRIIPRINALPAEAEQRAWYRRAIYQLYALSEFIDQLLLSSDPQLITQFGLYDKNALSAIKRDLLSETNA